MSVHEYNMRMLEQQNAEQAKRLAQLERAAPDYTQIADEPIRSFICGALTEMLDNPDEHGLYPTSKFMWKLERFVLGYKARGDASEAKLLAQRETLLKFLKQTQWSERSRDGDPECPVCGAWECLKHEDDCALAAAIKECEES
jgi:hypothetical protein